MHDVPRPCQWGRIRSPEARARIRLLVVRHSPIAWPGRPVLRASQEADDFFSGLHGFLVCLA